MAERRIVKGWIVERAPDGSIVPIAPAGASQAPQMPTDPAYPFQGQKAAAEVANSTANATGQNIDNSVKGATAPAVIGKTQADATKADVEATSAQRLNGLPPAEYSKALAQYNASLQLDRIIADMREKFAAGPGATHGVAGLKDFLPSPANQQFDKAGSQARGIVRNALGLTGGEANTAAEANMNLGGYIPSASNFDATNADIFTNLEGVRDNARRQAIQTLGGIPDANGKITPLAPEASQNAMQQPNLIENGLTAAPAGSDKKTAPIPAAMQDEYNGWIASHIKNLNPDDYVNFRKQLDAKYGFGSASDEDLRNWATQAAQRGTQGGNVNVTIPGAQQSMTGMEQFRNNLVNNPVGAAAVGALDNGGMGVVSALAPDQMQALGRAHPLAMPIGQIAGAIAGTSALGKLGKETLGKIAPSLLGGGGKGLAARTLATDLAYGTATGANQGQDPFDAALASGVGSLAGQGVGKALGTAVGGINLSPAVKMLRQRRIPLTVGQTLGGPAKGIEDAMTSLPGVGDIVNARRLEGARAFNRQAFNEAGQPIGANTGNIGEAGLNDLQGQIGNAYDRSTAGVTVPLDAQFGQDMAAAGGMGANLPADYAAKFDKIGENRIQPIVDAGQMTGDTFQQATRALKGYRASAGQAAPGFEQDYKDAISKAMDALRGQMTRGGGQSVISDLGNADEAYRGMKTLQKAVQAAKNGSGSGEVQTFMPSQLNTASTQAANKYGGGRQFAGLIDAGQEVLPSKLPDSGTAKRLLQAGIGGGLLTGGAYGETQGDHSTLAGSMLALGLLGIGGTKAGQSLLIKGLVDRPEALSKIGRGIAKKRGLFGAAAVPLSLESLQQ